MTGILDLPEHLLQLIQPFLTSSSINSLTKSINFDELQHGVEIKTRIYDNDWRNLMNTTSQFRNLKKKSVYLTLKDGYVRQYLRTTRFRNRVDRLVEHRHEQLEFIVDNLPDFHLELPYCDGCNQISLSAVVSSLDFSLLMEVKIINIRLGFFRVIYGLPNVQILTLRDCKRIQSIGKCPKLQVLEVSLCEELRRLFDLPSLKVLKTFYCPLLTVIPKMLYNLDYIAFNHDQPTPCFTLSYLTQLKGLHVGEIVGSDLTRLSGLETIALSGTGGREPLQLPSNLRHFHICNRIDPINYESLINLQSISVYMCRELTEFVVDLPRTLNTLSIRFCRRLERLILRSNVKKVDIVDNDLHASTPVKRECKLLLKVGVEYPQNVTVTGLVYFSLQIQG